MKAPDEYWFDKAEVTLEDIRKSLSPRYFVVTATEMKLVEAAIKWSKQHPATAQSVLDICSLSDQVLSERKE